MTQFRVLTAREQASITKLLEKANSALLGINSLLAGEVVKTRKVRKAKVAKAKDAPAAEPTKRRGRPPKAAAATPEEVI